MDFAVQLIPDSFENIERLVPIILPSDPLK